MSAMTLMVGLAKNGSSRAVSASGTASMSDSWIPIQPRIEEPSNPSPSVNVSVFRCSMGKEQCCQLPSMSTNFRSTISASCFLASAKKSSGVIETPPEGGASDQRRFVSDYLNA